MDPISILSPSEILQKKADARSTQATQEFSIIFNEAKKVIPPKIAATINQLNDKLSFALYFRFVVKQPTTEFWRMLFSSLLADFEAKGWYFLIESHNLQGCAISIINPHGFWKGLDCESVGLVLIGKDHPIHPSDDGYLRYSTPRKLFRSETCVFCLDRRAIKFFQKCGHLCLCRICARRGFQSCLICRQPSCMYTFDLKMLDWNISVIDT
jgi:hypothetical protein